MLYGNMKLAFFTNTKNTKNVTQHYTFSIRSI